jgi:hypothetical protein
MGLLVFYIYHQQEEASRLNMYIILDRTQCTCPIKKPSKCVQYVHRLEGICLLVYTFTSASLLGVVDFCRYVCTYVYSTYICVHHTVCGLVTKLIITKCICNKIYILQNLYIIIFIHNKI